ncbi:PQQ-binding-like beta-propeller repeat protein [Dietzia kunjamensis]|uniref:outer membrane protein assembly factor BamB family protein n=1 Tax=Dietzia kunjamensis TaxID=322509 RepID=UPI002DB6D9F6|nr:PQQ-binding-like beta-propeller repeat protein [Dietzia kunjamensis]MEB8326576.1 PQQ-binding-like beta-propeller repeat protein [Dietzia kunjamensis]
MASSRTRGLRPTLLTAATVTAATLAATAVTSTTVAHAEAGSLGSGSFTAGSLGSLGFGGSSETSGSPYAQTGWVTLHGDPGNRKQQLGVTPSADYSSWTALKGAAILTAPALLPNGNAAVTTGKAEGHANLHVLDRQGNVVWQAPEWEGKNGVDSGAIISSPIVDTDGNIFVGDGDQFWSYSSDGDLRWVVDLPAAPAPNPYATDSRAINPFITAVFTNDGAVMGTTAFGQVLVFDRQTGELRAPILQLPGSMAKRHTATPMSPSMWSDGFLDPAIKDPLFQIIFGGIVQSANTPAVDVKSGRVFVAATDVEQDKGALYGLDVTPPAPGKPGSISIGFAAQMGPGSGSSPVLSPDGLTVYTCDDEGLLYAFDTRTGDLKWSAPSDATAAAVSVDADGNIYVLTNPGVATAFNAAGDKLWDADLTAVTAQALPVSDVYGAPTVRGNGNPTVVNGAVMLAVFYGYDIPVQGTTVSVPVKNAIVELDPATGVARRTVQSTSDTTEGILGISPDGRMFATLGAMTTTATAPLAPLVNPNLPDGLEIMRPVGGLQGFLPIP